MQTVLVPGLLHFVFDFKISNTKSCSTIICANCFASVLLSGLRLKLCKTTLGKATVRLREYIFKD